MSFAGNNPELKYVPLHELNVADIVVQGRSRVPVFSVKYDSVLEATKLSQ